MRKSLILVVCLLCMASLMAAMAFTSAEVTSGAKFMVRDTANSLLRFDNYRFDDERESDEAGYTTGFSNGELWFDFTQGTGSKGFQPNSVYTYERLFRVTNEQNRNNERKSTIRITATTDLDYLYLYDKEGTCLIEDGNSTGASGVPGYYTIKFVIPSGATIDWKNPFGSEIVFTAVTVD